MFTIPLFLVKQSVMDLLHETGRVAILPIMSESGTLLMLNFLLCSSALFVQN